MEKEFGILWDYNGVIVDDEHLQEKSLANVVSRYGVELTNEYYQKECLGRPDRPAIENMKKVFPELTNVDIEELITQKIEEYQKIIEHESILSPGLKDVLASLKDTYRMAIITGAWRSEVEPVLQAEGIADLFEFIIPADEISMGKPNPEGYLKGVEKLGVPKEKIIVIEDTIVGIEAAKNAGLKCIAVCQTLSADQLQQADLILKNVSELTIEAIKEIL